MTESELNALSEKVIGCAYAIGNTLGCGFLEKFTKTRWLMKFES